MSGQHDATRHALGQGPGGSTDTPGAAPDAFASVPPRVVVAVVPLHLAPVGNRREDPFARARRTRREHSAVLAALAGQSPPPLPAVFVLVRVGWNRLDVDGLVACVKGPIDALAKWTGVDDRDRRLFWRLAQETTRVRRVGRDGMGYARIETACELRLTIRPWRPEDGDDPLRVLAAPPPWKAVP